MDGSLAITGAQLLLIGAGALGTIAFLFRLYDQTQQRVFDEKDRVIADRDVEIERLVAEADKRSHLLEGDRDFWRAQTLKLQTAQDTSIEALQDGMVALQTLLQRVLDGQERPGRGPR